MNAFITTCYPEFKAASRAVVTLPLSARSLLIKQCQAQTSFHPDDDSTLANLIRQHPPVTFQDPRGILRTGPLMDFFHVFDITLDDPLRSAILLDILRCSTLNISEIRAAREKGWATEIKLAETPGRPSVNFVAFFFDSQEPLHPDLPHNIPHLIRIRYRFRTFRNSLLEHRPIYYPRATHKNMSRSTRREFERIFDSSLEGYPIFGQDDWERVYHEHQIALDGLVEMRQKWYASGAKPRTYFAMGGTCYQKSRFLQDFFTDLVNIFPATNHITRLRPSRLRLSYDDPDDHYRIYDLSSFTSNMTEQREFIRCLMEFFRGVPVVIVDEVFGPSEVDLGDLLEDYYATCVVGPELSYERCFIEGEWLDDEAVRHARASMLGIFGNLMTCTLAHYLILSPTITSDDEINIAGDDGLVLETLLNKYALDIAISLVGDCAEDKTMRSNELGAVCLKRPLFEEPPSLILGFNVVPPNLAVCLSYLLGDSFDPRYEMHGLDELTVPERISVVGKDLLRFLESCYTWGVVAEDASRVLKGFKGIVRKTTGVYPRSGHLGKTGYIWPLDPVDYDYYSVSPLRCYATVCCDGLEFQCRGVEVIDKMDLRYAGDEVKGNSSRRLGLLERLGYLTKTPVVMTLEGISAVETWLALQSSKVVAPVLYQYCCFKDIPDQFVYDDVNL